MPDLKLPKLPDRTPVKLTISIMPELNEALSDYAKVYQSTDGQSEVVADLVPLMLKSFLDSDRGFAKAREALNKAQSGG
jgi:hypothetical protein